MAKLSGCDKYYEITDDNNISLAFAGIKEKPDLILSVWMMKYDKKDRLYFNLCSDDSEESWQEWDFDSADLCSDEVAKVIAQRMNHTFKFIENRKKNKYLQLVEQGLNESGEWETLLDEQIDYALIKPFLTKDLYKEKVVTYKFGEE